MIPYLWLPQEFIYLLSWLFSLLPQSRGVLFCVISRCGGALGMMIKSISAVAPFIYEMCACICTYTNLPYARLILPPTFNGMDTKQIIAQGTASSLRDSINSNSRACDAISLEKEIECEEWDAHTVQTAGRLKLTSATATFKLRDRREGNDPHLTRANGMEEGPWEWRKSELTFLVQSIPPTTLLFWF